jgi:hypothetical protein
MVHHKGSPIISILSRINPIPHIDDYSHKNNCNTVLIKMLAALLHSSILTIYPVHLYLLYLIVLPILDEQHKL